MRTTGDLASSVPLGALRSASEVCGERAETSGGVRVRVRYAQSLLDACRAGAMNRKYVQCAPGSRIEATQRW